jgi:hypothetical protein
MTIKQHFKFFIELSSMEHKTIQPVTLPVSITVKPWLFDHRFEGAALLPAVEMLQHMARAVQSHFPKAGVTSMQQASFDRFLRIEPSCTVIDACCNLVMEESGSIRATLTTAGKAGKGSVTRIKVNAAVCFSATALPVSQTPAGALGVYHIPGFEIPACRLYGELVPFGPAFQSVQDRVTLTESAAFARVYALDHTGAWGPLGSPFPFDGSLHAACAWAQRYCGSVAFPVGFAERVIVQPIAPGEEAMCTVIPVSVHEGTVRFDIWLHDQDGRLREMVKGVAMKDVSGGRITPPAWVRSVSPVRLA